MAFDASSLLSRPALDSRAEAIVDRYTKKAAKHDLVTRWVHRLQRVPEGDVWLVVFEHGPPISSTALSRGQHMRCAHAAVVRYDSDNHRAHLLKFYTLPELAMQRMRLAMQPSRLNHMDIPTDVSTLLGVLYTLSLLDSATIRKADIPPGLSAAELEEAEQPLADAIFMHVNGISTDTADLLAVLRSGVRFHFENHVYEFYTGGFMTQHASLVCQHRREVLFGSMQELHGSLLGGSGCGALITVLRTDPRMVHNVTVPIVSGLREAMAQGALTPGACLCARTNSRAWDAAITYC